MYKKCYKNKTSPTDSTTNVLCVFPFLFRDTWVPSRLPRQISEAHCLTSGCLSPQEGWEDSTLEVRPIQYQILVLHRWATAVVENMFLSVMPLVLLLEQESFLYSQKAHQGSQGRVIWKAFWLLIWYMLI